MSERSMDMAVGVIGHGYVGQAVEALFRPHLPVLVYDKFKPALADNLGDIVSASTIIFVCVPTPMKESGECHTAIVEEVLSDIFLTAIRVGADPKRFVVVLKSTVPPGFTDRMIQKYPSLRITFSPEFLTEASSVEDFKNCNRVIIGGSEEDAGVVYSTFYEVWEHRLESRDVTIVQCPPAVAEMTKLFTNTFLMTKVLFANEIYRVCAKLGISYQDVKNLACLDERIGESHLNVPGPDGHFGAGGSCFPKDINSLRFFCEQIGVDEKLFTAVIKRNEELRPEKDWKDLKGRAVV